MDNPPEPQTFIHGTRLRQKVGRAAAGDALHDALVPYEEWRRASLEITGRTPEDIVALVSLLNAYKDVVEPIFDARPNSAQEVLQPSILEEFFEYLFATLEDELQLENRARLVRRPANGFLSLVFHPRSMNSLLSAPEHTISRKDHDFVIGSALNVALGDANDSVIVPAVALECKRYLERNMLDECSGTAERVKRATPYCQYIVVSEYLKLDDCSPELSRIDEIYVLRKQRNSARLSADFVANPIYDDLVCDIYTSVVSHLRRIWWNPQSALETGKVFDY